VATDVWSSGLGTGAAALGPLPQVIGAGDFPPNYLIPIYKAAGRQYHIPWPVLAAINGIETDYGRNLSVSSAGAIGWMQFMPATWSTYAVAAAGQPKPNPYDPRAAIFAAAHLLAANGGAQHLREAIFAYNHAGWYVDAVLWRQQLITDWAAKGQPTTSLGYALPLEGRYMGLLGRTDEGVDIETAPDGAGVYSITAGVVTAVASDPTGFGPDYPVIRATAGPLAGHYIYYGHVAASLVHVGQRVAAGQPVAVMGHTGDAASLGHGHIEIGFSDAAGNPLNHPGIAATPSGAAMRSFLVELSGASGIHNS
jgi:murein DD-endopeptidase MepM/ murein hydrolase activator NlpD